MDRSSYFIKNRALFGSFPTQESVEELENEGVRFFVDLTFPDERKIVPYTTRYTYISFPIQDRRVPDNNIKFACFIIKLSTIIKQLKNNNLLYVHCKGGHGRSGVVVAILLCYMFSLTPEQSLEHTTRYHSKRSIMRDKWRALGSPQTIPQKNFVFQFCKPINFCKNYKSGITAGFSNFSLHSVTMEDLGTFMTSESAIQAYKNPTNLEYVRKLQNINNPIAAKNISQKIIFPLDWDSKISKIMFKILKAKFDQNCDIKSNLLNTKLRPIVYHYKDHNYWQTDEIDESKENLLGKILTKLREIYYKEIFPEYF